MKIISQNKLDNILDNDANYIAFGTSHFSGVKALLCNCILKQNSKGNMFFKYNNNVYNIYVARSGEYIAKLVKTIAS